MIEKAEHEVFGLFYQMRYSPPIITPYPLTYGLIGDSQFCFGYFWMVTTGQGACKITYCAVEPNNNFPTLDFLMIPRKI